MNTDRIYQVESEVNGSMVRDHRSRANHLDYWSDVT